MTPKKELQLAYAIAGILLVVGIFSFFASSAPPPKVPLRIMFHTVAGNVLFNHKAHYSADQYGISCRDCHHHPPEGNDIDYEPCGDCHQVVGQSQVPKACLNCHDKDEIEGTEMSKASDAMHSQCIGCHKDYGAGPVKCKQCHV